jgi:hypothetical protein
MRENNMNIAVNHEAQHLMAETTTISTEVTQRHTKYKSLMFMMQA